MMHIGYGEDIHVLVSGRKLLLGGIEIPYDKGEKAHSDGDVLIHALCDALLGALACGDIGRFFPDTEKETEGMDSKLMLSLVYNKIIKGTGYHLVNADITVILEKPKLVNYIMPIRQSIADIMGISTDFISVKAGTNEGLDAIGRNEAIKVIAVVLLEGEDC